MTGERVVEAKIYFEFDSDELGPEARAELDQAATWVDRQETGLIVVEGYTDKVGDAAYNQALGERRGEAAKAYLVAKGVAVDRIRVISYGEEQPERDTERRAEENRRIVIYAVRKPAEEAVAEVPVGPEVPVEPEVAVEPEVPTEPEVPAEPAAPIEPRVPIQAQETASVDRSGRGLGLQLMAGVGLTNQMDSDTSDVTELGGMWDVRVAFFNHRFIGFEAAYVGSLQEVNVLGLDNDARLAGNGAEVNLRLNLLRSGFFRPYVFGGLGWTHYDLTDTETADAAVEDGDDLLAIPAGVGLGLRLFSSVTLDIRAALRATFGDETFDPTPDGEELGMESWSSTAQLGFEF